MRTFVFAYDRFESMTTSRLLGDAGVDHVVLCHGGEDRDRFLEAGTIGDTGEIVATHEPRGLARQRNVALEMLEDGEWALFLVDDLHRFSELDTYDSEPDEILPIDIDNVSSWNARFKNWTDVRRLRDRAIEGSRYCDLVGSHLIGWASSGNPLFRRRKWARNVHADGRAWAVKKSDLRFDVNVETIDDYYWTAANIERFGTVIVNQWILPEARRYTAGGYGSMDDRMEQKIRDCSYLVDRFPGLVHYRAKKNWPEGSHVVIRAPRG